MDKYFQNNNNSDFTEKTYDIYDKTIEIIKRQKNIKIINELTLETKIQNLELSSIEFIKLVVDLEKTFDFEFEYEFLLSSKFSSIKSLIDYIKEKNVERL